MFSTKNLTLKYKTNCSVGAVGSFTFDRIKNQSKNEKDESFRTITLSEIQEKIQKLTF